MKIKISKTDKRYTGYRHFQYVVDLQYTNDQTTTVLGSRRNHKIKKFHEIRDWCIQTWGMSCEREHWLSLVDTEPHNAHWCWQTEFNDIKIYLKTDKEANWFKLKWV
jgi:hypothetical protein